MPLLIGYLALITSRTLLSQAIEFNSTPSGNIISKHSKPATGFFIEMDGQNIKAGMGSSSYSTITGSALATNQYYHAALSYEVASNTFKFYLDGVLVNTKTITEPFTPNVTNNISIGSSDYWGGYSNLTVDYFRIWEIQKSDSDLDTFKNVEVACSSTNLLVQYKFDSGETIKDCTPKNNDGIFFGRTLSTPKFNSVATIKLHPNPSTEYIQISHLKTEQNFSIHNLLGKVVGKGKVSNGEKIDVQNYQNGLYLLKFENGCILKFIKE